jgi:hypothetical protein
MTPPTTLYRARRYSLHGFWRTWYEPCPVIRSTSKTVTVSSQTFPDAPLYPGGEFRLRWDEKTLCCYHSRHGEWFWVAASARRFSVPLEGRARVRRFRDLRSAKSWLVGRPQPAWASWQRLCFMYATLLKEPLGEIVEDWKFCGDSIFDDLAAMHREKHRLFLKNLAEETP